MNSMLGTSNRCANSAASFAIVSNLLSLLSVFFSLEIERFISTKTMFETPNIVAYLTTVSIFDPFGNPCINVT